MAETLRKWESAGDKTRRSRRQLLAGAAGALGAIAAGALVKTTPAEANTGDAVIAGFNNFASSNTTINTTVGVGLAGNTQDASAYGLYGSGGQHAVKGDNSLTPGNGVTGYSGSGAGVLGISLSGAGVSGATNSTAGGATGVYGEISSTSPGSYSAAVRGANKGTAGLGIGVYGSQDGTGWGVYGTSTGGIGVYGLAGTGIGVSGRSNSGTGVSGTGSTGVSGVGGGSAGIGVIGQGSGSGPGLSATGGATNGAGLLAQGAGSGNGVTGIGGSSGGNGLDGRAVSSTGAGVLAENVGGGLALKSNGPAQFNGPTQFSRSGRVNIASPNKTATVTGVALAGTSLILATVQNSLGVFVQAAVPNVPGSSFKIVLSKAPAAGKTATVAWFVVN